MYIKEIKLNGFKSFADRTNIELNSSFTGIVGPNGSGKSNIVDAIKWVLGEQSVKSLRGGSDMTDIIFNGSASRKPSTHASVCIVFDNTDKSLNIPYNEVSIKRVLFKNGENEYYLNSERCRLKDISTLLIDSMSSRESFNIIPQNKIDEILSEKPYDRRVIFEDAAGVLKYKKRKEESLRKLEKTHDNVSRINLIIDELSVSLLPLEKSSIKAREYKTALSELESVEIALAAKDITSFSVLLEEKKLRKTEIEDKLSKTNTSSTTDNAESEKIKLEIIKNDDLISDVSNKIFTINEQIVELSNKKTLMSERVKYDKTSSDVKNNLLILKEKECTLDNSKKKLELEIDNLDKINNTQKDKLESLLIDKNKLEKDKLTSSEALNQNNKKSLEVKNKIDVLTTSIESMNKVPYSVKEIINNPTLRGIHNIIGNLIEVKSEYSIMLDTALGFSSNNIVVDDEVCAKEAIEYLKSHSKGRATFFPLNVIKPKSIEPSILRNIKDITGYIGICADLVNYDNKYYNIVMNQLGNIIVAKDINSALMISKKINHMYRVVSLDGEIIHVGGSLTGGSNKSNNSYLFDKYELERYSTILNNLIEKNKTIEQEYNKILNEEELLNNSIYNTNIEIARNNELINSKKESLLHLSNEYTLVVNEISNLENSHEKLDKELSNVIDEYYKLEQTKIEYEKNLELYNKQKQDLNSTLVTLESSIKKLQNENLEYIKEMNTLDLDITKLNIALDNLLNRLSEDYSIGYERAKKEYVLSIDENIAREKVSTLRKKIKSLGEVNLGSIEEYERVSTRVNFLNKQKDDLVKSENDLLNIINEMDNVMKDKFLITFENINTEFNKVFKTLFKGGNAKLKLTDPDNILETGIDIIAIPPGKTEKHLSLLSGGEKTLTAISLLFSIMNLKNVPFVILDEVESALDEANANIFGEYLANYRNKTQLLVITHKKKTMEFLDLLYGVTMEESGVSKLVSVKLEN